MIRKDLFKEYVVREEEYAHAPYLPELEFYAYIKAGNVKKVHEFCSEPLHLKKGLGILSDNNLQHFKYHFVVTAALIARYCIEGGMALPTAYSLSDFYIKKVDKCRAPEDVSRLHDIMCEDYATRMAELLNSEIKSRHIVTTVDYIYDHLNQVIKVSDIADICGISQAHLSRQFKKETGYSVSEYAMKIKINTAANMLEYSNLSISQIASQFAFSSQSHFAECFKQYKGTTPSSYRHDMQGKMKLN